jgi:ABC-2 type transport system ATP-binding protein
MSTPHAIEATDLRKRYGDMDALAGIDLEVPAGSVCGLLGPNGAGKTTAVRILTTLATADGGSARVAGFDVAREPMEVRRRIGLAAQDATVDGLLTGRENLVMIGELHHVGRKVARRRAPELLEQFDLTDAGDKLAKDYSGGMRRRLDLAATLVARPDVLFLDEPTTGLDPRSRQAMWEVIGELVADGVTVFLTTQYLEEADRLAERIALIDGGRIAVEGTPAELKRRVAGPRLDVTMADGRTLSVATDGSAPSVRALLDELDPAGDAIAAFALHDPTLDDVFLALTARRELAHV